MINGSASVWNRKGVIIMVLMFSLSEQGNSESCGQILCWYAVRPLFHQSVAWL